MSVAPTSASARWDREILRLAAAGYSLRLERPPEDDEWAAYFVRPEEWEQGLDISGGDYSYGPTPQNAILGAARRATSGEPR